MSRVRRRWLAAWGGALQRRWPLETRRDALTVGAAWTAMTVVFEFSFGGLVQKESWEEMLAAYNLAEGELWPIVLAWVGIGPEVARRLCPPRISSSPS